MTTGFDTKGKSKHPLWHIVLFVFKPDDFVSRHEKYESRYLNSIRAVPTNLSRGSPRCGITKVQGGPKTCWQFRVILFVLPTILVYGNARIKWFTL